LALIFSEKNRLIIQISKSLDRKQENEEAVNELFMLMLPLDKGDFTNKIAMDDRFMMRVAQRIDRIRLTLADVVRKMKSSAHIILQSANETEETSKTLMTVSQEQFRKVDESIAKIGLVTSGMDEVAQLTWIAKEESMKAQ